MTSRMYARLLSIFQDGDVVHEVWATLDKAKDFIRLESSLEAEMWVSALPLNYLSIAREEKSAILGSCF